MKLLDARQVFGDLPVVHVATTMADGSPHAVPLWFLWRNEGIYISCRRDSATWRNVERDARVALSFRIGKVWEDFAGAVVYGRAEPLSPEHPALRGVMSEWFEKYRGMLSGDGFRAYARHVAVPGMLRIRAQRMTGWDHAVDLGVEAPPQDAQQG